MDPIEKAIRNALEKGDATDRTFREKVYRSVFAALDRSLKANPGLTVENAIKRRKALQARIAEIEAEFQPRPVPEVGAAASRAAQDGRAEPSFGEPEQHEHVLPEVPDIIPEGMATAPFAVEPDQRRPVKPRRRKRPYIWAFMGITVLALLIMAGMWAYNTGLFLSADQRDTAVRTQPNTGEAEDYDPNDGSSPPPLSAEQEADREWITVFDPSDPATVTAPSQTKAQAMQDDTGAFFRIDSGTSGSAILFDVGQGVLEQIAGKRVLFDIEARAESGASQISIDCNFGDLGDCGRRRYQINFERNDYLFELEMPNKRPGAGGTIAINSDIGGQGRSVDIYQIRMSISE